MENIFIITVGFLFIVACAIHNYLAGMKAGVHQLIEILIDNEIVEAVENDEGSIEIIAKVDSNTKL